MSETVWVTIITVVLGGLMGGFFSFLMRSATPAAPPDTSEREVWESLTDEDREWFAAHNYPGPPVDLGPLLEHPERGGFTVKLHVGDPGVTGRMNRSVGGPESRPIIFSRTDSQLRTPLGSTPTWSCGLEGDAVETLTHASVWRHGMLVGPIRFSDPEEWGKGASYTLYSAQIEIVMVPR